jgi:hypothetical protein
MTTRLIRASLLLTGLKVLLMLLLFDADAVLWLVFEFVFVFELETYVRLLAFESAFEYAPAVADGDGWLACTYREIGDGE